MARQRHAGTSSDAGRSCLSKHRHATKGEALDHLARNLHENRKKGIKTGDLHVYQCAYCVGGWHVGHPIGSAARTRIRRAEIARPRRWERIQEEAE